MAVNEGDKEEEKFEFDAAGEGVGYISLEEARIQAIEHARDNPGYYGRRYRSTTLVWEVDSAQESEDHYEIRLSFRPGDSPSGQVGLEQFIFDKTGQLRVRQTLRHPRRSRTSPALALVAGGATIAIAVVVVLFATGVLSPKAVATTTPIIVPVLPEERAILVSPQGEVRVDLKAGAVDLPVALRYRPVILEQTAPRPLGLIPSSPVFDLSVDIEADSVDGKFTFNAPVTLTVQLPAEAEDLAGGVASTVVIQHLSSVDAGWTALPTTVDFQSSTAQAQIESLSLFALTVRKPPQEARMVPAQRPRPIRGYAGQGFARLSAPRELPQGEEGQVSLEVALEDPLALDEIRFVAVKPDRPTAKEPLSPVTGPPMRVERYEDVPVYSRMKAKLEGESFKITQPAQAKKSLVDGTADWSWRITPKEGSSGFQDLVVQISANGRVYRTLETTVLITTVGAPTTTPTGTPIPTATSAPIPTATSAPIPTDTPTPIPTNTPTLTKTELPTATPKPTAVPVPTARPVPVATPTPVPTVTPAPVQEWRLEDVLVAGDKVTVLVQILGPGRFDVTLDGNAAEETVTDGSLQAHVFRNVPPGRHTVRVFTVGVRGQEELRDLEVMPPTPTSPRLPRPAVRRFPPCRPLTSCISTASLSRRWVR